MKWLFAVLVALNIIVFGSMVAYRTQHKNRQNPESALEGGTHEYCAHLLDAPKPSLSRHRNPIGWRMNQTA